MYIEEPWDVLLLMIQWEYISSFAEQVQQKYQSMVLPNPGTLIQGPLQNTYT